MEEIKSALGISARSSSTEEDANSIFAVLKEEHRQVLNNLRQILDANQPKPDMFAQTVVALNAHMKGEEEVLYPRLEDNPSTKRLVFMAYDEHNIAKQLVSNMNVETMGVDRWIAKVTLLNNILSNHIGMEEKEVFPKAKEVLHSQTENQMKSQYLSRAQPTPTVAYTESEQSRDRVLHT